MDFVEWADTVLHTLIDLTREVDGGNSIGVHENRLADRLFSSKRAVTAVESEQQRSGMFDAMLSLEAIGAVDGVRKKWFTVTRGGRQHAADPVSVWQQVCAEPLAPEEEELLRLINRLSPEPMDGYVQLRAIEEEEAALKLAWPNARNQVHGWARTLVDAGYLRRLGVDLVSSYKGLVWETRRAFTQQAALIDQLVADWETTSVDHKQELELDYSDQKAELVKDVIALANTLVSGRRWLVIGFSDRTRMYHKPPNPKIGQDRLEQIVGQYVTPYLNISYEVVESRHGPVGLIEVRPERSKLPYMVSKPLTGMKRSIVAGDLWVRHGSHSVKPDPDELDSLREEATRARGTPAS